MARERMKEINRRRKRKFERLKAAKKEAIAASASSKK